MSINLQEVVEAIEKFDEYDYSQTYYYRKKDKLVDRFSEEWMSGEIENLLYRGNDELVPLPNARDLDEYAILENFVLQLDDRYASAILYNCIQGKGAFKRFKETCDLLGLLPAYWNFQHHEHVVIAREFCEQNDIAYDDIVYGNEVKTEETAVLEPETKPAPESSVIEVIRQFVNERDWDQFHSPENLAKSISIEAGELLECFQWNGHDYDLENVKDELADVMIYCLQMCDKMKLDPEKIMMKKMEKNAEKYPVNKAKGNYTKYNSYK